MTKRSKDWGWLVVSVLMILAGVKALAKGHVQHFLLPEFQAFGASAIAAGVFLSYSRTDLVDSLAEESAGGSE